MKPISANAAILAALKSGRALSQLDVREFGVEDMRTPISHLKPKYQATHNLKWEWVKTSGGAKIKRYWLELKHDLPEGDTTFPKPDPLDSMFKEPKSLFRKLFHK